MFTLCVPRFDHPTLRAVVPPWTSGICLPCCNNLLLISRRVFAMNIIRVYLGNHSNVVSFT